jgi:NACalpha-BTF3-like transcription factor
MSRKVRGKAGEDTPNKELESKIELVRNFSGWSNREDILRALEEAGNDPQRAISYIMDGKFLCCCVI